MGVIKMVNEYVAPPPDPTPATIQPNMNAPNPGGMGSPSSGFDANGRYIGPGSGAPGSTLTYNEYTRGVQMGTIPNGNVYPVGSSDWYEYEIAMREMTARRNVASGNDTNYNTTNNPPPGVIIPEKFDENSAAGMAARAAARGETVDPYVLARARAQGFQGVVKTTDYEASRQTVPSRYLGEARYMEDLGKYASVPGVDMYVPVTEQAQKRISDAKISYTPGGSFNIMQIPARHSQPMIVAGGGDAALQSGMFSGKPQTPVVYDDYGNPLWAEKDAEAVKEIQRYPERFSRLGSEVYGGVTRLDDRTIQSEFLKGNLIMPGRFQPEAYNYANLVDFQGSNLQKKDTGTKLLPSYASTRFAEEPVFQELNIKTGKFEERRPGFGETPYEKGVLQEPIKVAAQTNVVPITGGVERGIGMPASQMVEKQTMEMPTGMGVNPASIKGAFGMTGILPIGMTENKPKETPSTTLPTPFSSTGKSTLFPQDQKYIISRSEPTISGGNVTITNLGAELDETKSKLDIAASNLDLTNKADVTKYNTEVAKYNEKRDTYMKMQEQNPVLATTNIESFNIRILDRNQFFGERKPVVEKSALDTSLDWLGGNIRAIGQVTPEINLVDLGIVGIDKTSKTGKINPVFGANPVGGLISGLASREGAQPRQGILESGRDTLEFGEYSKWGSDVSNLIQKTTGTSEETNKARIEITQERLSKAQTPWENYMAASHLAGYKMYGSVVENPEGILSTGEQMAIATPAFGAVEKGVQFGAGAVAGKLGAKLPTVKISQEAASYIVPSVFGTAIAGEVTKSDKGWFTDISEKNVVSRTGEMAPYLAAMAVGSKIPEVVPKFANWYFEKPTGETPWGEEASLLPRGRREWVTLDDIVAKSKSTKIETPLKSTTETPKKYGVDIERKIIDRQWEPLPETPSTARKMNWFETKNIQEIQITPERRASIEASRQKALDIASGKGALYESTTYAEPGRSQSAIAIEAEMIPSLDVSTTAKVQTPKEVISTSRTLAQRHFEIGDPFTAMRRGTVSKGLTKSELGLNVPEYMKSMQQMPTTELSPTRADLLANQAELAIQKQVQPTSLLQRQMTAQENIMLQEQPAQQSQITKVLLKQLQPLQTKQGQKLSQLESIRQTTKTKKETTKEKVTILPKVTMITATIPSSEPEQKTDVIAKILPETKPVVEPKITPITEKKVTPIITPKPKIEPVIEVPVVPIPLPSWDNSGGVTGFYKTRTSKKTELLSWIGKPKSKTPSKTPSKSKPLVDTEMSRIIKPSKRREWVSEQRKGTVRKPAKFIKKK